MAVITHKDQARLRLGFDGRSVDVDASSRQTGVIVWGDGREVIPVGSLVNARVDRPTLDQPAFDPTDHFIAPTQGYVFEHAPEPGAFTVGGVSFRGRQRVLHVAPGNAGVMAPTQREPAWAAFSPSVTGVLVPEGNGRHPGIVMPGQAGSTPNLAPADRHLLRMRWLGTPAAAPVPQGPDAGPGFDFAADAITRNDGGDWTTEFQLGDYVIVTLATNIANDGTWGPITNVTAGVLTIASGGLTVSAGDNTAVFTRSNALVTLAGAETSIGAATWGLAQRKNLVPGSIVITLPGPFTVRDNGSGRLVALGAGGARFDGTVNYLTGAWELNIANTVIGAGDVVATFEHSCPYAPLDVEVEWDALLAQ